MQEWLNEHENEEDHNVPPHFILKPENALSGQVLQAVATSAAIDDGLYNLDKALARDVIDLRTFMKEVRKLSAKQFMARALAQKLAETGKRRRASLGRGGGGSVYKY